jgi:hypothetical protein
VYWDIYNKKSMKSLIKQLLRENLLLEGQPYPFQETNKTEYGIQYEFIADNIPYIVTLITNEQKEIYEVGFNVKNEEDVAHRTKKDLLHLNNVLSTVDDIVKKAVYDYRIKKISFSGAREESDSKAIFLKSLRDKTYLRYLKQHHPNAIIDDDRQGNSFVIMKSIYPEVFEKNKNEKDILIDLLMEISDEDPDEDYFTRNISFNKYTNKIQCEIDGIANSKLGRAEIEISHDYGYDVNINLIDTDENFEGNFKNFNQVLAFIKQTFSTQQELSKETNEGDKMLNAITNKLEGLNYTVKPFKANVHRDLIKRYDVPEDMVYLKYFEDNGQFDIFFTFDNHDYFISHFEGSGYLLEILDEGTSKVKTSKEFENFEALLHYI